MVVVGVQGKDQYCSGSDVSWSFARACQLSGGEYILYNVNPNNCYKNLREMIDLLKYTGHTITEDYDIK